MPETALELDAGTDIGVESGMVDATSSASVLGSAGEAVESIGMTTKTAYPIQRRMSRPEMRRVIRTRSPSCSACCKKASK